MLASSTLSAHERYTYRLMIEPPCGAPIRGLTPRESVRLREVDGPIAPCVTTGWQCECGRTFGWAGGVTSCRSYHR